ncbi:MAG: hypothetical protein J6S85_12880 [Methanobrevibacter sp.]|nr:hypothetical protein [Methanobrevibacter sp.]
MDITMLVQAISTVGFPIASFLLMFFLVKEDISKLTDAVSNNTKSTELLCELIKNINKESEV